MIAGVVASYKTRTTRNNPYELYPARGRHRLDGASGVPARARFRQGAMCRTPRPCSCAERSPCAMRRSRRSWQTPSARSPIWTCRAAPPFSRSSGGEAGREAAHALCAHPECGPSALLKRIPGRGMVHGGYESPPIEKRWEKHLVGFLGKRSIDKGTRGSAGRKCPHTASKPLRIHKVFSAAFPCLRAFLLRQNCFASDSLGFSRDFCSFGRRRAVARQGEKGQKHRKAGCPTCVLLLIDATIRKNQGR